MNKYKTYEDGLNEAWELANKIPIMEASDIREIFLCDYAPDEIVKNFSAVEVINKIKKWKNEKEAKKFHAWEVVTVIDSGKIGVVTQVEKDIKYTGDYFAKILFKNGDVFSYRCSSLEKTGRTIDISTLLSEIRGKD